MRLTKYNSVCNPVISKAYQGNGNEGQYGSANEHDIEL